LFLPKLIIESDHSPVSTR